MWLEMDLKASIARPIGFGKTLRLGNETKNRAVYVLDSHTMMQDTDVSRSTTESLVDL